MKRIEGKFTLYLNEKTGEAINSVCSEMKEDDYIVKIQEAAGNIKVAGIKIEKSQSVENSFRVEGKNWSVVFNWDSVKVAIGDTLKERIAVLFWKTRHKFNIFAHSN